MKDIRKKILRFFGFAIWGCTISISTQFIHELSFKDWIINIICGILIASAYLFFEWQDKTKKENKANSKLE